MADKMNPESKAFISVIHLVMSLCLGRGGPLRKNLQGDWMKPSVCHIQSRPVGCFFVFFLLIVEPGSNSSVLLMAQGATLDTCHRNAVLFLNEILAKASWDWNQNVKNYDFRMQPGEIDVWHFRLSAALQFLCCERVQRHVKFQIFFHTPCLCFHPSWEQTLLLFIFLCMCVFFFVSASLTAKSLVARLMEVDQDQRLTAQEAINHEW